MTCSLITTPEGIQVYHRGAPPERGALPALFYLALSGEESLCLDPFNQPVQSLVDEQLRIYSVTLPAHGEGLSPNEAMQRWAEKVEQGQSPVGPVVDEIPRAVTYLIEAGLIDPAHIAIAGLSRGAFAAAHVASVDPRFRTLLGFAPLTRLTGAGSFKEVWHLPQAAALNIDRLALYDRTIRFYIGNRDTLVGTDQCFQAVEALVEAAHNQRIRSAPIEMIISASIGYQGHGTSPEVFRAGASWVQQRLLGGNP